MATSGNTDPTRATAAPIAVSARTVAHGTWNATTHLFTPSVVTPKRVAAHASATPPAAPSTAPAPESSAASVRNTRPIWRRDEPSACRVPTSRTRSRSDIESVWKITYSPSTSARRPSIRMPVRNARSSAA